MQKGIRILLDCICGKSHGFDVSIANFDLHCTDASFRFVSIQDDTIVLAEKDKTEYCNCCRKESKPIVTPLVDSFMRTSYVQTPVQSYPAAEDLLTRFAKYVEAS